MTPSLLQEFWIREGSKGVKEGSKGVKEGKFKRRKRREVQKA
jgi:hypothetical protein